MFSGIVEEVGAVAVRTAGSRLQIRAATVLKDLRPGHSVAVNGACLTAVEVGPGWFAVEVSPETAARTTLDALAAGAPVNLERALRLDGRLGGHFVQGHVDGVGEVESLEREADFATLTVRLPSSLIGFCVEKGSIAVDGVSLTIAALDGERVRIAVIPHTLAGTTAGTYAPGTRVNLEADLLAKLVAAQLAPYRSALRKG